MKLEKVMSSLEEMGNEQTKKVLKRHGAKEPFFGVKIGDMKKLVKKIKKDHDLALELYRTGNGDAKYLASLIADENKMTEEILQEWVEGADWYMLSECAVAWIAADSGLGWEMGLKWIKSEDPNIASAGWSALSSHVAITPDNNLKIPELKVLLDSVQENIHNSPNRVRYTMNGFVIAVGSYVCALTSTAKKIAEAIGKVHVEMGGTACKVPQAKSYIEKVEKMDRIGKKRKMARC
jgi:hypothetical protein